MRDFEKVILVLSIVKDVVNIAKMDDLSLGDKLQQALYLKDWSKLIQVPSLRSQLKALCVSALKSSRTCRKVMLKQLKWKMQCVILHDVHDNERQVLNRLDSTILFLNGHGTKRQLDSEYTSQVAASAVKRSPVSDSEDSPSFFRTSSASCGVSSPIKLENSGVSGGASRHHVEHTQEMEVNDSESFNGADVADDAGHMRKYYEKKLHLADF